MKVKHDEGSLKCIYELLVVTNNIFLEIPSYFLLCFVGYNISPSGKILHYFTTTYVCFV
jgi:hypothetical protein